MQVAKVMGKEKEPTIRFAYGYTTRQMTWEVRKIVEAGGLFGIHLGKRLMM